MVGWTQNKFILFLNDELKKIILDVWWIQKISSWMMYESKKVHLIET